MFLLFFIGSFILGIISIIVTGNARSGGPLETLSGITALISLAIFTICFVSFPLSRYENKLKVDHIEYIREEFTNAEKTKLDIRSLSDEVIKCNKTILKWNQTKAWYANGLIIPKKCKEVKIITGND